MARKERRQGFLIRWVAPLIAGPLATAAAFSYLSGSIEREDLGSVRPTILDFGREPSPPILRQPLKADPPPPVDAMNRKLAAKATEPDLPSAPPPNSFDAVFPRITVLDSARFRTIRDRETLNVHLAGINGVAFSEICNGSAGRWNCGARARADLARLIGPRAVGCVSIAADGDDGEVRANCWVGKRNLSLFMVSRGWADPVDPADPLLSPYAARAKQEKLGRYGDSSLQPPDTADE